MTQYIKNPSRHQKDSGSESAWTGSWDSSTSSSFLNTSFESEFDSNETEREDEDDDEFIAELTRRMADDMLDADDNPPPKDSGFRIPISQEHPRQSYADTVKKSIKGSKSNRRHSDDHQIQPPDIQLYKVENQPRVGEWGKRGKMTESTQYSKPSRVGRGEMGEFVNGRKGFHGPLAPTGSGMRAIFLGGSGSRTGSSGTGVFLPRTAADSAELTRKKPGCSTVLIPTRVLQALEQHFSNMESLSTSTSIHQADMNDIQVTSLSEGHQEPKLPHEWIY